MDTGVNKGTQLDVYVQMGYPIRWIRNREFPSLISPSK